MIISFDSYTITPNDLPAKFLTNYSMNGHFF